VRILAVKRQGLPVETPLSDIRLEAGDVLRVTSPLDRLMELHSLPGMSLRAEDRYAGSLVTEPGAERVSTQRRRERTEELRLIETVVGSQSRLVGRSVRQLDFRRTYQVLVLALHRRGGDILEKDFSGLPLEPGDSLLLQGEPDAIQRLESDDDFLILSPIRHRRPRHSKRPIVLLLCAGVIGGASVGILPVSALALIAAVLCVLFRCLAPQEAYRAIEWRIVMMIFGMLSLGLALEKTGGARWVADATVDLFREAGPWVILSLILLLCSALTEFLSNNAVAVLLTPIVIEIASHLGVEARPFLMAVVLGASASFATPIGYQTNTLVYGAGGYRFSDFLRVGLPMNLLIWAVGSLAIPWLWPLTPR
jgi:di/tricarboxylate transporter